MADGATQRRAGSMPATAAPPKPLPAKLQRAKTAAFARNTQTPEERAQILELFKTSKHRKSLSAEEVTTVHPETNELGKWIRPRLTFDASSEHVPPPPPEPIPTELLLEPPPPPVVPMAVADSKAPNRKSVVLARATSGVFRSNSQSSSTLTAEASSKLEASKKKARASFMREATKPEEERKQTLHAFRSSKFRKSLTADEMVTVDPTTNELGKWIRPRLTFDTSSEHVPPPPEEPIPPEILAKPPPPMLVPMAVADKTAPGRKSLIMVRRTSGTYPTNPARAEAVRRASVEVAAAAKTGVDARVRDPAMVSLELEAEASAKKSQQAEDVLSGRPVRVIKTSSEMVAPSYGSNYAPSKTVTVSGVGKALGDKLKVGEEEEDESGFDRVEVYRNPRRSVGLS
jgi:hypothetical protein